MQQDLRKSFEEFRLYTLQCINSVNDDDYDLLDSSILKRQEILDLIIKMNCSVDECSIIANELDILSLEKMLSNGILEKRKELRNRIDSIDRKKAATIGYNNGLKGSLIFSKKI